MQLPTCATLLCAITGLCLVACSKGPGDEPQPIAQEAGLQHQPSQGPEAHTERANEAGSADGIATSVDVGRLRLPDMESLPSERELAASKPSDQGGGGVIARPPSE